MDHWGSTEVKGAIPHSYEFKNKSVGRNSLIRSWVMNLEVNIYTCPTQRPMNLAQRYYLRLAAAYLRGIRPEMQEQYPGPLAFLTNTQLESLFEWGQAGAYACTDSNERWACRA